MSPTYCDDSHGCPWAAACEDCEASLCPTHGTVERSLCTHRETCQPCEAEEPCRQCAREAA